MTNKSFILFENPGVADFFALFLLGFTDKDRRTDAIGQFGSGFKFGLCAALRRELRVIVFLGRDEITFKTVQRQVGTDRADQVVFVRKPVDGPPEEHATNMTLTLGRKDWGGGWPIFRELLQNAVDGDPRAYEVVAGVEPRGREGYTRVFLEADKDVLEIYRNLDQYWKTEQHAVFVCDQGRLYPKGAGAAEARWYVKGMFVQTTREFSLFDYDVANTSITESRTALTGNLYKHVLRILDLASPDIKAEVLRYVIDRTQEGGASLEANLYWSETTRGYQWAEAFRRAYPDVLIATDNAGYLAAARSGRRVARCPQELAAMLCGYGVLTAEQALREHPNKHGEPFEPNGSMRACFDLAFQRVAARMPEVNRLTITFVRLPPDQKNISFIMRNRARGEVQFTETLLRSGVRVTMTAMIDALAQCRSGAGRFDPDYTDQLLQLCVQSIEGNDFAGD